jgi:PLP dependent protein
MNTLIHNLQEIKMRLNTACDNFKRDRSSVNLLAVSKTFPAEDIAMLYMAGQKAFGENYVQEAMPKMVQLKHLAIEWHLIGPLQSNKTRLVAESFSWVESIDRIKIAQRLNDQRPSELAQLNVCIQVNIDNGINKSGALPSEVASIAHAIISMPRLKLRGLMFLPEPSIDIAHKNKILLDCRYVFTKMIEQGFFLDTLSIGMSDSLEMAVACGSTQVRIGSAIFGMRS